MKLSYTLAIISSSLSGIGLALPQLGIPISLPIPLPPIFDPKDPRFDQWRPAGPEDSRGPCPGLNSLANHGFLPRSGKNITIIDIIRGAFQGYGLSPEVSIFAGGIELAKAYRLAAFDLHELSNHGFIEHDCSMSREDIEIGNNNDFNASIWEPSLQALMKHDIITAQAIGEARTARDVVSFAHNPKSTCGARAVVLGSLENGLLLSCLGGKPKRDWVRSLVEDQRIPTHLGYVPTPILSNNALSFVTVGLESLVSQPYLVSLLGNMTIATPGDLLAEAFPVKNYDLSYIASVVNLAGFPFIDLSKIL